MLVLYTALLGPMVHPTTFSTRVDISSTSLSTVKRIAAFADVCTLLAFVITIATLVVVVALTWKVASELYAHPPGRNLQHVSHPYHRCNGAARAAQKWP